MNRAVKLTVALIVLWGFWTIVFAVDGNTLAAGQNNRFHPSRIIIKPKADINAFELEKFHQNKGVKIYRKFHELGNIQSIIIPKGMSVEEAVNFYAASGLVEYAEPDYLIHADQITPNDPLYLSGSQWNLNNTGQFGGVPDADIDAPEGWAIQNSASNIIVAIIDSGIRYSHEDLKDNMWKNPGEIPGNGIDDDNNGYIDDIYGINAVDGAANPGDPMDDFGHGTHVAGIIGASANNGKGIAGIAWKVKLMALKFIDSSNNGYLSDAVECINYAIKKGAKIINASWGSPDSSYTLQSAISSARNAGIIFVASAGNDSKDNDSTPTYPACYNLDNIISVAATDLSDSLANYSNYGATTVDLAAPGTSIYSTFFINDSYYLYLSGTSMAAPHVSAICALAWERFYIHNYRQIISRVLQGVDKIPSLAGKCVTGGRANLYKVLSNYQVVYTNYSWISTNGMTPLTLADNGVSSAIPIPFDFKFYGNVKRSVYVGANGLIGFNPAGMDKTSNTTIANTNTPNDAVYVYWDDLNPASKGTIHYGITGNAPDRKFVVTWSGVPRKAANNVTLTFQVILEERKNTIVCQYQQVQPSRLVSGGGGTSATVGIENADGTMGAEFIADGNPITLSNNLAIIFIPYLPEGMVVGPSADLVASGPAGGPFTPSFQEYYITNTGNVPLEWRVESLASWITVYPSNGTLGGLDFTNIVVSINEIATSMPVGSYRGELNFTNLTSGLGSIRRSVTLLINGTNAVLSVSPLTDFNASGNAGGPFSPQNALYTLMNTGDAPLEWRAEFSDGWLKVTPTNGSLSPMQSVTVAIEINSNAFSFNPGFYSEIVRFRNMTTGMGTTEIAVNLTIKQPSGILQIIPSAPFETRGITGKDFNPLSAQYIFTNAGAGTLTWYATNIPLWISISPQNGSLTSGGTSIFTVSLNSNAMNMPVGDYFDSITLVITNGSTEKMTIPTILHVYPEPALLVAGTEPGAYNLETFEGMTSNLTNINIQIKNAGGSNLFWISEVSEDWLSLSIDYGILPPQESQTIAIIPELNIIEQMPVGVYTNNIRLTNQANPENTTGITVVLNIRKRPVIDINKTQVMQIQLIVRGETNQEYVVEKSSNFYRWEAIETNRTSVDGIFFFTDNLNLSNAYYRIKLNLK